MTISGLPICRKSPTLATLVASAGVLAAAAIVDTGYAHAADAPGSSAGAGVEEVIVTARRRAERIQDVPGAVTAVTEQTLTDRNIVNISGLNALTPGMRISAQAATNDSLAIQSRGQTVQTGDSSLDPSVAVYVDGVYIPRLFGANGALTDVKQIELLRGPQGTLFGRNTPGGAIQITTNDPNYDGINGYAKISGGNLGKKSVEGALNLPIVKDKAAIRLVLKWETGDGYGRNLTTGERFAHFRALEGRGKLLLNPTDRLKIIVSGETFTMDSMVSPIQPTWFVAGANGTTKITGRTVVAPNFASPSDPNDPNYYLSLISGPSYDGWQNRISCGNNLRPRTCVEPGASTTRITQVSTTGTYELNDHTQLKTILAYRELNTHVNSDLDGTPFDILSSTTAYNGFRTIQTELQLNGSLFNDRLSYATGLFYYHERGTDSGQQGVRTASYAIYAQATYKIFEKLSATLGGRYFVDDKKPAAISFLEPTGGCRLPNVLRNDPLGGCVANFHRMDSKVPFTFSLEYKPVEELLVYGKIARGFRSGGFNAKAATSTPNNAAQAALFASFKPEQITEYEAGLKSQFFNRRLTANLAVYYDELGHIQRTSNQSAPGLANPISQIVSSVKGRVYGAELEVTGNITPEWQVGGTLAWASYGYSAFTDRVVGDRTGEPFPFAPKSTYSLYVNYTHEMDFGRFRAHVDYFHTSEIAFVTGAASPGQTLDTFSQSGYGLLGARMSFEFNDQVELGVYGANLADKKYAIGAISTPFAAFKALGEPRTYGADLKYRF